MDIATAFLKLIDQYGPILAAVAVLAGCVLTGLLRWGPGVEKEMAFREQLRLEERTGRLEAEKRLDLSLSIGRDATDLAGKYESILREKT